jgi:serine protease Do
MHALSDKLKVAAISIHQSGAASLRTRLAVATLALFAILALAAQPAGAAARPDSFADLAEKVSPSVVGVVVERQFRGVAHNEGDDQADPFAPGSPYREFFERFFGEDFPGFQGPEPDNGPRQHQQRSLGSGFIISADGFVVTNNHVIEDAGAINVVLDDGSELQAELIGSDRRTDLALLKVETDEPLPPVEFGDSDAIRVGDWIMAVGNPFGFGGTVTVGVISARGRDLSGGTLVDFLQIDAPINRGNSGGPTFNLDGEVIGINTAIFSPNGGSIGIGFAIPSTAAERIIEDLKDDGQVHRGWLGVHIQPVDEAIAEGFGLDSPKGALVAQVQPDSPAAAAGLKAGDVVLEWDGRPIEKFKDLSRFVAETPAGTEVEVVLWREAEETTLAVETGMLDEERMAARNVGTHKGTARKLDKLGLRLSELDDQRRERLGLGEEMEGVLVTKVEQGSPADQAGLRRGDVIASVALDDVDSLEEFEEALEEAGEQGKERIPLLINRGGRETFVTLEINAG